MSSVSLLLKGGGMKLYENGNNHKSFHFCASTANRLQPFYAFKFSKPCLTEKSLQKYYFPTCALVSMAMINVSLSVWFAVSSSMR